MADLPSKYPQNTLLLNRKTSSSVSSGEDLHAPRQAKLHKTFIVHGRHHTRVPSYGRNLNKTCRHSASAVSEVPSLLVKSKSSVSCDDLLKKSELLVKKENIEKNAENTERTPKEQLHIEDEKEKHIEPLKEAEQRENFESLRENVFSSVNITISSLEKKDDFNEEYVDKSQAEHITKRLVSMTNNQVAVPYLTCETAMAKNIPTTQLTSTKEFSCILPSSDNLGKTSTKSSVEPPTSNVLKYAASDPLFRNPISRTQQKLLLQRESSLSSVKSQSNKDHDYCEFIQHRINRINKEYSNILRLSDPLKHVILKLFNDGCLEEVKNIPSSLNHKTAEEKLPKNTSKFVDLIGKRENVFKESDKSKIEYDDMLSIQIILEEMWKSNENIS
ncbi:hypothetical protein PNEG_03412 [Pneumocystis murina B123]|uniref:Uncharacterized protein n=1 Tax=Pneumocystis murina (strain B123) TaxID=1069680 RepID=M7P336_PNEMU|nr:hypothetical protein PNEG_03412 [Pneumocystis murina B123]EMR08245.1 hypothetical protein PNEG_03412 [Pneumocystis murina B123]